MKKLLAVLFALGLVLAFAMPAAAADVSVSGSFYAGGVYDDNQDLLDNSGASDAFYFQRLRVQTTLKVNPALKLVTRFDAMEGYWNGTAGPTEYAGAGTRDDDNIDFDRAYLEAKLKYGVLSVGYMSDGAWGTWFANEEVETPRIKFITMVKGWMLGAIYTKGGEFDHNTRYSNRDNDKYLVLAIKPFKGGAAGLLWVYLDYRSGSDVFANGNGYRTTFHLLEPYVKAKIGDLYIEAEAIWDIGTVQDWSAASGQQDVDKDSLSAYVNAKYSLSGGAYVGGQVAFVEGDDADPTTNTAGQSGADYDPCLILWNSDLYMWQGNVAMGTNNTTTDTMTNAWLYQAYAGYAVNPNLSLLASYTYAKVDEQGTNLDEEIGTEFDITATYKVMDNLEYMVGLGYFWTGDYFKGASATAKVDDDYIVMNKLTLSF